LGRVALDTAWTETSSTVGVGVVKRAGVEVALTAFEITGLGGVCPDEVEEQALTSSAAHSH
jgi:hypothetical protein